MTIQMTQYNSWSAWNIDKNKYIKCIKIYKMTDIKCNLSGFVKKINGDSQIYN